MTPARSRLPNRRPAYTETLEVDGQGFEATVGFDPESGQPRELFLTAGKEGSMLNAPPPSASAASRAESSRSTGKDVTQPSPICATRSQSEACYVRSDVPPIPLAKS